MKKGFGLIVTPETEAPWGHGVCGNLQCPDSDTHLQRYARIGGNQTYTNSCVWWAISNAIYTILRFENLPSFWTSVLAGYYITRMRTNGGNKNNIIDIGCRPPDAMMSMLEVGLICDSKWPFVERNVDKEPLFDSLISSMDSWISMKRIIVPEGKMFQTIKEAIHHKNTPVLIGNDVDQPYLDWKPGNLPWSFSHKLIGRHMEMVDSYESNSVLAVSSWGEQFRRHIHKNHLESIHLKEAWFPVIDIAKADKMLSNWRTK